MSRGVPFTDLTAMTRDIRPAVDRAWADLLNSSRFVGGAAVEDFEQAWASYCGAPEAVGVGNGTDALLLTLMALGIGAGDDVIVPANTFIASADDLFFLIALAAPRNRRAEPVPVAPRRSPRTRAVMTEVRT